MTNLERIMDALKASDLDALLITSDVNRFFASGFPSSAGVCVVTKEKGYLFTDFRYIEAARAQAKGFAVAMTTREKPYAALIRDVLSSDAVGALGFEEEKVTVSEHMSFCESLRVKLAPAQGILTKLRAAKQPGELAVMRRAQEITDFVFAQTLKLVRPGVSEKELACELVYGLLKNGAENVSFDPIVVSGENTSKPHGVPGARKIREGDFVTMDFGCIYEGYCSDMTRTVAVGRATDEMKKVYDIVLRAQEAGIRAARAGKAGRGIDAAARSLIENEGYGACFGHGFGHGLGIEVHEKPGASPSENELLPEGAVISAEPGIYLAGRFGVRIEDVLVLSREGCEDLTGSPKNLIVV